MQPQLRSKHKKPNRKQELDEEITPHQRDMIRTERNNALIKRLTQESGVTNCWVMQLDDHTDKTSVEFACTYVDKYNKVFCH